MPKRKRPTICVAEIVEKAAICAPRPGPAVIVDVQGQSRTRRQGQARAAEVVANPNINHNIIDGQEALRASPDSESSLSDLPTERIDPSLPEYGTSSRSITKSQMKKEMNKDDTKELKVKVVTTEVLKSASKENFEDPEANESPSEAIEDIQAAALRPPPVNSDVLPLPWRGRLGYACLCTYLRFANPPVFSSRTCRIASIIEQRHPLKDPSQPPHPTKNRPDREQAADIARGQAYVEGLGLANARDIPKMLLWNERFGIRFFRLSSEMFPFASHETYGYSLAPFASEALAEAGRIAAKYNHRLTTHPGQFTQLGSPRKEVIAASLRDLNYHNELLSLLKLPPQQDRDAVTILHLGGVFGDKAATLDRFRTNYRALPDAVKRRLVLENDDVSWSVHELLPICQELNIPLVLDYHHHNIIHSDEVREGTRDIIDLYDDIRATWTRKNITQKMHYSEPTASAVTGQQRRKHSPRVAMLPSCRPDMDLMIEAKDKEQAVFHLMRTFRLPGHDKFNDIIPHVRIDENRPEAKRAKKKTPAKKNTAIKTEDGIEAEEINEELAHEDAVAALLRAHVPEDEISMGGKDGRVFWPSGMEEWLRPMKRVVKKKEQTDVIKPESSTPLKKRAKKEVTLKVEQDIVADPTTNGNAKSPAKKKGKSATTVQTPSVSAADEEEKLPVPAKEATKAKPALRRGARGSARNTKQVDYREVV